MANRIPQIIIDMSGDNNFQYVRVVQGDSESEIAEILFVSEGEQWSIPNNVRVTLRGTKPDGNPILNDCEVTENGTVIIKSTEQLTAVLGRRKYEICLYNTEENNQGSVTSFPFYIVVVESAMNPKDVVSSYEFTALQNVFASVNSKTEAVDKAVIDVNNTLAEAENVVSTVSVLQNEMETLKEELSESEIVRESNETVRQENENLRQQSLSEMQTSVESMVATAQSNITNAISNANNAIENADAATERANVAAQACENIVAGMGFISTSEKGVANGVATLNENGIIPDSQMNKDSIIAEITNENIVSALGYTPESSTATKVNSIVSVLSSGWTTSAPYEQTISIDGLLPDSKYDVFVKPVFDDTDTPDIVKNKIKNFGFITEESVIENGLLFICHNKKPSIDFSILVKEV